MLNKHNRTNEGIDSEIAYLEQKIKDIQSRIDELKAQKS